MELIASDVVVNYKVPRLFFAGDIGDLHLRLQVRYASESKVSNDRGTKSLERVCKSVLGSKAKPSPPKQSVNFKCQIWSKILRNLLRSAWMRLACL